MRLLISAVLAALLLLRSPSAFALDPALDVNQYSHTAWTVREGSFKDPISAIAQTPDGYLWLGTQFGLLRFDGVRHVLWQPPPGQYLPSINIRSLFAGSDGRLWIGTQLGLASWKDGRLTVHREIAATVGGMIEDREGAVWAGTRYPPPGMVCAFGKARVQCYGDNREFGVRATSLFVDGAGSLWIGSEHRLWRWKPGAPTFYPVTNFESSRGIVELDDGVLLIAERDKLLQLARENVVEYRLGIEGLRGQYSCLLRDRDGALWIGTFDRGLIHVHQGKVDLFSRTDGLSSNYVRGLLEDREGNIWVATDNGLDRFRRTAVATMSVQHGLSDSTPWSVLAGTDGSIWVGTLAGLNRFYDGQVTVYRRQSRTVLRTQPGFAAARVVREVTDTGLPHDLIQSIFEDYRQRLWVSTHGGLVFFENGRFTPVSGIPFGVHAITGDAAGNIWISEDQSLYRVVDGRIVDRIPWARLGRRTPAMPMIPEPARRGVWLAFRDGTGVAYFEQGRIIASYDAAKGLGRGLVGCLQRDPDGTIWAATEGGLSRIMDGRVQTLTARNGLPCDPVHWIIEDDEHSFWLYMACGLARVARRELDAWAAQSESDQELEQTVHATLFDQSDGVRIHASAGAYAPQVSKSGDGRIWFLPWDGVSVIDPRRIPHNTLPPLVHVEDITADGQHYRVSPDLRLPPRVRDLSIEYTALSLVAPEKIHFRYKLEGQDPEWKEVLNDRRVQYSNLPPGEYRFRVTASNNSGVWSKEGADLKFTIAPAYYQTGWFQALAAAGFVGLLWSAYRIRVRFLVNQFNMTVEARVGERTRIARELHDTLLQSFQGLLLMFESALNLLPDSPVEARRRLERALGHAMEATTEARNAVQGLRSSTVETTDLAQRLRQIVEELTAEQAPCCPVIRVTAHDTPRRLKVAIFDEVTRIAGEALRNAYRHAEARQITANIHYEERALRIHVHDDGRGFDDQALRHEPPAGHFGLHGMRERAEILGGTLHVYTSPGAGTAIELNVPAAVAYAAAPGRRLRSVMSGPQST